MVMAYGNELVRGLGLLFMLFITYTLFREMHKE